MPFDPFQQNNGNYAALEARVAALETRPALPYHTHTGTDSNKVMFDDLSQRKLRGCWTIPGTSAATATNYGVFFLARFPCVVTEIAEVHQTAGTDGSAVTLNIEKLNSGEALDGGDVLLTTAFSLKATVNVPQQGTLTTTLANLNLIAGDRLAFKDAGTLTTVANVTVYVELTY